MPHLSHKGCGCRDDPVWASHVLDMCQLCHSSASRLPVLPETWCSQPSVSIVASEHSAISKD